MNKMKRKSIIGMLLLSMVFGMFSTSCQDMLSPSSERHAYTVAEDTLYSYWGILKSLQNIAERYVILNECRGDLVDASGYVSDTIAAIVNFDTESEKLKDGASAYLRISDYYHIINSCNAYIAMCDTMRTTGTNQKYMLKEYSQVQSIRAWVYMQLLYTYGENKVPFYTEPMLTTDDINNFVADENHPKLSARLLADVLGPKLEEMEPIEVNLGLPQYEGLPNYNNYGDQSSGSSHFVCHSTKCMFPVSIVLGDLYLLSGDYVKAATHYYNYINTPNCGPLGVENCFSRGWLNDRLDYPVYNNYYTSTNTSSSAYKETSAISRSSEAITCIPSNKGKLEGKVLTDISRLFGFEAQLRTSNDESASASVSLSREYERELIPSKGYETLCDAQPYEIYLGTKTNDIFNYESLEVLPGVGDARRAWIYNKDGAQWNFQVGDDLLTGKMVSKQNPGGQFTTTYPVIYRKSTVWLRYAEALNRAGFPSYAFAILKTGLCNNPDWFPVDPNKEMMSNGSYVPATARYFPYFSLSGVGFDYKVTDSLFYYNDIKVVDGVEVNEIIPNVNGETKLSTYVELEKYLTNYFQTEYDEYQARYEASLGTEEELEPMESPRTIDKNQVYWTLDGEEALSNQPSDYCTAACYYIGRNELERAASTPYLNFNQPYLRGQSQSQLIYYKEQGQLLNDKTGNLRIPSSTSVDYTYTIGVHQRGCGFIRYDDPIEFRSRYNYVTQVGKKLKEVRALAQDATDADAAAYIYSNEPEKIENVKNAVEDLIIDECALELAFEGSRFSDLCRVAMRRGDANYLAERVSKRHTGEVDENLRSKLSDMNKWFLPVPEQ